MMASGRVGFGKQARDLLGDEAARSVPVKPPGRRGADLIVSYAEPNLGMGGAKAFGSQLARNEAGKVEEDEAPTPAGQNESDEHAGRLGLGGHERGNPPRRRLCS